MKKLLSFLLITVICMTSVPVYAVNDNTRYGTFSEDGTGLGFDKVFSNATEQVDEEILEDTESLEASGLESDYEFVVEETQESIEVNAPANNSIVLVSNLNNTIHYSQDDIVMNFELYHYGGSGQQYYVAVLDEYGNVYGDYLGDFSSSYGNTELELTLYGPNDPGMYCLSFAASGDEAAEIQPPTYIFYIVDKPNATTGLKASSAGGNKVNLTWDKAYGAEGYLIYAQKNGKYGYVGMTSKTGYTDTKALSDAYNFYWVFPYVQDNSGKMHTSGCPKYVYAKGVCPAPTNFKATSVLGGVKLTWKAAQGAEGYLIYGIVNNGSYKYVGMTSGTAFTDKKAAKDIWSFYWVFPYHYENGKMITGFIPPYVYGRAK